MIITRDESTVKFSRCTREEAIEAFENLKADGKIDESAKMELA
jgi:hypothetical protein